MRVLPKTDAVETAVAKLQEALTVLKAGGQLDDAATIAIGDTLDSVADLIMPPGEPTPAETGERTLKQILSQVSRSLKNLGVEAQAADYALGDKTDAILSDVEIAASMAAELDQPVETATEPEGMAPAVAEPEAIEGETATTAADTEPQHEEISEPAGPTEPTETAVETAAETTVETKGEPEVTPPPPPPETVEEITETATETVEQDAAGSEPTLDPRYATKEDLTQLAATITASMTETLQKALQPVAELKSALQVAPATQPVYRAPAREKLPPVIEEFDMALSPDLDGIDEYGRIR